MDEPTLTAVRWKIGEYLFVEYLEGDGIMIDLGPFPTNPSDEQLDQAYAYLQKAALNFLSLGELEWTLDQDKLAADFPELNVLNLHGPLAHPPAFETTSRPAPRHFFDKGLPVDGFYFLRISFEFEPEATTPESAQDISENAETLRIDVPKFIS